MTRPTEKRKNERSDRQAQVKYSYPDNENFLRVEMINFSRGGMCFESGYEVGTGARIRIKKLASPAEEGSPKENDGCLAEVKWCKPISGKDAFFYRVGVEYVEPVNPDQCFEWRAGDKICISPPLPMAS